MTKWQKYDLIKKYLNQFFIKNDIRLLFIKNDLVYFLQKMT